MNVNREQKRESLESLRDVFSSTGVVVVAHYSGLTVAEMTNLRVDIKQAGGQVKVAKNRLVKLALQGKDQEGMSDLFTGPTLIAFSDDPVAAPKIAVEFAKKNENLVILGGAMGSEIMDVNAIKTLASLPSLDELRGKLVGLIQAPAGKIARVTAAPAGQVARVIGAYGASE